MYHHWMVELFLINEETDMPEQKQKKKTEGKKTKKNKGKRPARENTSTQWITSTIPCQAEPHLT